MPLLWGMRECVLESYPPADVPDRKLRGRDELFRLRASGGGSEREECFNLDARERS